MRRAMLTGLVPILALLSALEAKCSSEQAGFWRIYSSSGGFPDSSFRSVTVAGNGGVLAVNSTSSGVCEFDGYESKLIPLPTDVLGRVYESPAGQLWACSSNGLKTMKDGIWQSLALPELSAAILASLARDLPLYPLRQNIILCLLPERLAEVNAERPRNAVARTLLESSQTKIGKFSAMAVDGSDELWIVGQRGLCRSAGLLRGAGPESSWREFVPPDSLRIHDLRKPQPDDSGITLVADSEDEVGQMQVHFDGANWETRLFGVAGIQNAWTGPDHTAWAASSNALYQWRDGALVLVANMSPQIYRDVSVDGRGTFWLATSEGLIRFTPSLWRGPETGAMPNIGVQRLAGGRVPMDAAGELISYDIDARPWENLASASGQIRARPLGLLRDGRTCFEIASVGGSPSEPRLGTWDSRDFRTLPFTLPNTGDADGFSCILETVTGDIWLGGTFGVAWLHNRWNVFPKLDNTTPHGVNHLVELPDGRIWSASRDRIWSFDGRNWTTARSGLHAISAVISTRDGSVWVGQSRGVMRFFRGNWIENGVEEGLDGDRVTALCEDQRGGIWAIESNTLARFHPEADSDPPRTVLHPISERAKNVPEDGALAVKFGGEDKWGVTARERLVYSQKLDDGDWSPFSARMSATLSDLAPGRHSFQVHSMDRAGNVEASPSHLEFTVILPWYQEGRLVLIAAAGTTAALFFATLAYKRHRQLVLSYAEVEKQVAERSRQLDIANQEILQSQKMRALGTLSAGIAHDFNNILSIIKGSIQIIELNRENPEKIGTWISRIRTVVDQGSAVVQAMLGFSRSSDEALELCDVNPVIDNTLKLLGDQFLSEVQVSVESGPDLPRVRASQSLMQQILLNFIFNAAESMNGRKRIVITTARPGSLPASMALQPVEADAYVWVSVRDFGCGISPENVARVFEPFFTTKALSVHPGTGLGLSIVYELAKKMRAGLSLESVLGEGSVFSLILPAGQSA